MTAYLFIGGPLHGEVRETPEGGPFRVAEHIQLNPSQFIASDEVPNVELQLKTVTYRLVEMAFKDHPEYANYDKGYIRGVMAPQGTPDIAVQYQLMDYLFKQWIKEDPHKSEAMPCKGH